MDINLTTPFLMTKEVLPVMRKNKFGSMIHVSSVDALSGDDKPQDAYGASKAAMIRLSKSIAIQLQRVVFSILYKVFCILHLLFDCDITLIVYINSHESFYINSHEFFLDFHFSYPFLSFPTCGCHAPWLLHTYPLLDLLSPWQFQCSPRLCYLF